MSFGPRCCVCGREDFDVSVSLWLGCYSCRDHQWREILAAPDVFARLRRLEVSYFREYMREAALLVWASSSLRDVRQDASTQGVLRMPDGIRILVSYVDAYPSMFACDRVLASSLLGASGAEDASAKRAGTISAEKT